MGTATSSWSSSMLVPAVRGDGQTPYLNVSQFPRAVACLDISNPHIDTLTMFDSYQEALDWRSNLAQQEIREDHTIPRLSEQKKALVKLLFIAFKSIANSNDSEGMVVAFREHKHDNGRVEVLCWMLLEACIRRAESGPLLFSFNPDKAKYNSQMQIFAERFDEMIFSMATSKTICKHLYDAPYPNHFVDDPIMARKRVDANRALNKRKGAMMAQGRKLRTSVHGDVEGEGDFRGGSSTGIHQQTPQSATPPNRGYSGGNEGFKTPTHLGTQARTPLIASTTPAGSPLNRGLFGSPSAMPPSRPLPAVPSTSIYTSRPSASQDPRRDAFFQPLPTFRPGTGIQGFPTAMQEYGDAGTINPYLCSVSADPSAPGSTFNTLSEPFTFDEEDGEEFNNLAKAILDLCEPSYRRVPTVPGPLDPEQPSRVMPIRSASAYSTMPSQVQSQQISTASPHSSPEVEKLTEDDKEEDPDYNPAGDSNKKRRY